VIADAVQEHDRGERRLRVRRQRDVELQLARAALPVVTFFSTRARAIAASS
jgi:hypothetical protein